MVHNCSVFGTLIYPTPMPSNYQKSGRHDHTETTIWNCSCALDSINPSTLPNNDTREATTRKRVDIHQSRRASIPQRERQAWQHLLQHDPDTNRFSPNQGQRRTQTRRPCWQPTDRISGLHNNPRRWRGQQERQDRDQRQDKRRRQEARTHPPRQHSRRHRSLRQQGKQAIFTVLPLSQGPSSRYDAYHKHNHY